MFFCTGSIKVVASYGQTNMLTNHNNTIRTYSVVLLRIKYVAHTNEKGLQNAPN